MAVLDDILAGQEADQNQNLAIAAHGAAWANFFNNTPSDEVMRKNLNLTNMVDDAVQRKQDLLAQTDQRAAEIRLKNAQFQEFQNQAPLREQLLQAHIDAAGAAEKRKAIEATMEHDQTAALEKGYVKLLQSGAQKGSPELQSGLIDLIANNPHANPSHLSEFGKLAGVPDGDGIDYVKFAKDSKASRQAAIDSGVPESDIVMETFQGHPVWKQRITPLVSPEQRLANDVAREKALQSVRNAGKPTPEQKALQLQDAMVGGSLKFGHLDAKGNIVPDKEGGTATHVASFYQDPTTGKMHETPPMTIAEFQTFQNKVSARNATAAPSTPHTPSDAENTPQLDISQEEHARLKPGDKFWWKGQQLTKQ